MKKSIYLMIVLAGLVVLCINGINPGVSEDSLLGDNSKPLPSPAPSIPVNPFSSISISPTSATIYVGQSVEFTANISGGTPPIDIRWYYNQNGVDVPSGSGSTFTFTPTSAGNYAVYFFLRDATGYGTIMLNPSTVAVLALPFTSTQTYSYVTQWGSFGSGEGQFNKPNGIAIDNSGNVYVTDSGNHRVEKFDVNGTFITAWGSLGSNEGQFLNPHGVAVDGSGYVYVVDTGNNSVQKFDGNGTFMLGWGTSGSGNGQFNSPYGVAIDSSGNVYVTDIGNANPTRVQKFTSEGVLLSAWGTSGTPMGVAVDNSGNVYVLDAYHYRVQKFDSNGAFILLWTWGSGIRFFDSACVAVDRSGNVYIGDSFEYVVRKYNGVGTGITSWGGKGSGNGEFNNTSGIALDASGYVYVVDSVNNRVQKFVGIGPVPSPTPTPTPTPTPIPSPNPTTTSSASFGDVPVSNFNITSPSNTTYNSNNLKLDVTGRVIAVSNVKLGMSYRIDNQETIPLSITAIPSPSDPSEFINTSASLPQLTDGSHIVTVFGDLEISNISHPAQATVYFTVDTTTPSPTPSPIPTPTPNISANPSSSPRQTQQPTTSTTTQPTSTPNPQTLPQETYYIAAIIAAILIIGAVALLLRKRRRSTQ